MADFEKLIDIDLQTQYHKEEKSINEGFKLYLFEALYSIQQFYGLYKFLDIIFIIIEFIQLMAFPMDKAFDKSWGDTWVNTIGNFFRYFQLMHLWHGTSFSIIAYILTIIYIINYIMNSASIYKIETPAEDKDKGVDETNRETGMNLRKSWNNSTLSAYNTQFYFKSSAKDLSQ